MSTSLKYDFDSNRLNTKFHTQPSGYETYLVEGPLGPFTNNEGIYQETIDPPWAMACRLAFLSIYAILTPVPGCNWKAVHLPRRSMDESRLFSSCLFKIQYVYAYIDVYVVMYIGILILNPHDAVRKRADYMKFMMACNS